MSRLGADPQDLRRLASLFERAGEGLADDARSLGRTIRATGWDGPDAQRYLAEWDTRHKGALLEASDELTRSATSLRGEAAGQEGASGAGGFAGATASGSTPVSDVASSSTDGKYDDFDDRSQWQPLPSDASSTLSDDALTWEETQQGGLGDCYMLSSLIAVVQEDPDFVREHMTLNPNGTWTVTLYDDGTPVEVTVGPLGPDGGAHDDDGRPNYATIYEAAMVDFLADHPDVTGTDRDGTGSYEDIGEGGQPNEALAIITGRESQAVDLRSDGFLGIGGSEVGYDELSRMADDGYLVLSTQGDDPDGPLWFDDPTIDDDAVVPNHAYVVESVEKVGDDDFKVVVRNPWGPDGGYYGGAERAGTLTLSRDELYDNFDRAYSAPRV